MAIPLTWQNLFILVGLAILILSTFGGAVATVVQWELNTIDHRLNDRLELYHREMDRVEMRLERLEQQR